MGHPAPEPGGRGGTWRGCPQGPAPQGRSLLVLAEVTKCLGVLGFPGREDAFRLPMDSPGLASSSCFGVKHGTLLVPQPSGGGGMKMPLMRICW